jgi:hypothetical protein
VIIKAATAWRTNADMILAVVELGYIQPHDDVIDLTYGRGKWWTKYKPGSLAHSETWDFTALPYGLDAIFDVAVFDPPYVSTGGRKTSTIPDFNDRYGTATTPKNPYLTHEKNMRGLKNAMRVTKPKGLILYKCMDYVSSGELMMTSHWAWNEALDMGLTVQDRFIFLGNGSIQSKNRAQKHARNNFSTLYIFRTPKEPR